MPRNKSFTCEIPVRGSFSSLNFCVDCSALEKHEHFHPAKICRYTVSKFDSFHRCEDEQNMVAYQHCGEIYYRTFKDVQPGQELLVWYGEEYADDLGINLLPRKSELLYSRL